MKLYYVNKLNKIKNCKSMIYKGLDLGSNAKYNNI